jgi:hypothetical protein
VAEGGQPRNPEEAAFKMMKKTEGGKETEYIKGKFNVIQNDNACNHYRKHKNSIGSSCAKSEAARGPGYV